MYNYCNVNFLTIQNSGNSVVEEVITTSGGVSFYTLRSNTISKEDSTFLTQDEGAAKLIMGLCISINFVVKMACALTPCTCYVIFLFLRE